MLFEVTSAQDLWEKEKPYQPHTPVTEISCKLMMYDLKLQVPVEFLH